MRGAKIRPGAEQLRRFSTAVKKSPKISSSAISILSTVSRSISVLPYLAFDRPCKNNFILKTLASHRAIKLSCSSSSSQ